MLVRDRLDENTGAAAESLANRLHARIDQRGDDECWPWLGALNNRGYGVIRAGGRADGRLFLVQRVVHVLAGTSTEGLEVMHSCDNRPCCNSRHLSDGTHAENIDDMCGKKRQAMGVRNAHSKLNDASVAVLRNSLESSASLSRRHGVSRQTIQKARSGKTWRHVS